MKIELAPCPMFYLYYDTEDVGEQKIAVTAETRMFNSMEHISKEFDRLEQEGVSCVFLLELYGKRDDSSGPIYFARFAYLDPTIWYGLKKHAEVRQWSKDA